MGGGGKSLSLCVGEIRPGIFAQPENESLFNILIATQHGLFNTFCT